MELESTSREAGHETVLLAKFVELLVHISRLYMQSDTTEARALLRVGEVIGSLEIDDAKDWNLADMLRMAHMSRSNFMRIFKKATGQSPIEYLLSLRTQERMKLLRNTGSTITETAFGVGFSDSNYFSRQFRQVLGQSPRDFRLSENTGR